MHLGLKMIKDVLITNQKIINVSEGNVLHAVKSSDVGYLGFGEAYFSIINNGAIKAWKRHRKMTLNLIVPLGKVRFVLYDNRNSLNTQFQEVIISKKNYCRLTIPPMIWVGFQGLYENESLILNIADIEHDANEVDKKSIDHIVFDWKALK